MDKRDKDDAAAARQSADLEETAFCWKELLDRAFSGWAPADQSLERIIDRAERKNR